MMQNLHRIFTLYYYKNTVLSNILTTLYNSHSPDGSSVWTAVYARLHNDRRHSMACHPSAVAVRSNFNQLRSTWCRLVVGVNYRQQETGYTLHNYISVNSWSCKLYCMFRLDLDVTPIFKSGSKSKTSNYRPVSLTSQICKIFMLLLFSEYDHNASGSSSGDVTQIVLSKSKLRHTPVSVSL